MRKLLVRLFDFLKITNAEQTYQKDKRYDYLLILITIDGIKFTRIYSTSSPLTTGHSIVLAPNQGFIVNHIAHVVYTKNDTPKLTRSTTFVHAAVENTSTIQMSASKLLELGFDTQDKIPLHTLH